MPVVRSGHDLSLAKCDHGHMLPAFSSGFHWLRFTRMFSDLHYLYTLTPLRALIGRLSAHSNAARLTMKS